MRKLSGESGIDLVAIGRRIRELRGFDMRQAEFARRIHVSQSYLSALERGEKEPGAAVLLAISRAFGKSVDWLLTEKKNRCLIANEVTNKSLALGQWRRGQHDVYRQADSAFYQQLSQGTVWPRCPRTRLYNSPVP